MANAHLILTLRFYCIRVSLRMLRLLVLALLVLSCMRV
jgi:hypothetical protein